MKIELHGIEVFGYLTAAPTSPSPVTGVYVEISSTDPAIAITPIAGSPGIANNQLANTTHGWSNIYRTTTVTTDRAVMRMRVNLANPITIATPGVYWLIFQFTGVNFCPPVTVLGAANTGNSKQRIGATGAWAAMVDTGNPVQPVPFTCNVPFNLYGVVTQPLGSITQSSAGCGNTTIRVGGSPVPGGLLRSDVTSSNPGIGLVLIGYGFVGVPTPFCGCLVGHEWSVINLATSSQVNVPQDPSWYGLALFVQGAELNGIGGCPGPQVTFTNTHKFQM